MTFSSRAIAWVYSRMVWMTFWESVCGGSTMAASPEWTPAYSMCSKHAAHDDGSLRRVREMADIGDAIHIHLGGVFEKFVHEHRAFRRSFDGKAHVMRQFRIGINDLHRAAAEHERRPDEDGITQLVRRGERFGFVGGEAVGRLRNVQLAQHGREQFAVFGDLDALRRGADDVDAVFLQAQREVQRRLAAELGDGAPAFFALINMQHIFQRERLEKQFVAGVVIRGNRFGVRIDHQRFEAVFLERERGMHAAIIKFNALADAVGAAAKNHDLARGRGADFVIAAIVGGIIIGRVSLEFGGAGVHEAIAGDEAKLFALGADGVLGAPGEMGDLAVGKSERFGFG